MYAGLLGPSYETPAEVRMLRTLGADAVGMSTVLEAIAARWVGLDVCGVSLVTNLGAGYSGQPLTHAEVMAAGEEAGPRLARVLQQFVAGQPAERLGSRETSSGELDPRPSVPRPFLPDRRLATVSRDARARAAPLRMPNDHHGWISHEGRWDQPSRSVSVPANGYG